MLVVGLTGGIGSGKTAVSDAFGRHSVPIIDTDLIARQLVSPDQPAFREIVGAFGPNCVDKSGKLDRKFMRDKIFAYTTSRHHLEAILHPRIRQAVRNHIATLHHPYSIVVVPLLVESDMSDLVQRILVVDVPEELQKTRVMARDASDRTQVEQILAAQASRTKRLAIADDIIDNTADFAHLETQVFKLHQQYLTIAARCQPQQNNSETQL